MLGPTYWLRVVLDRLAQFSGWHLCDMETVLKNGPMKIMMKASVYYISCQCSWSGHVTSWAYNCTSPGSTCPVLLIPFTGYTTWHARSINRNWRSSNYAHNQLTEGGFIGYSTLTGLDKDYHRTSYNKIIPLQTQRQTTPTYPHTTYAHTHTTHTLTHYIRTNHSPSPHRVLKQLLCRGYDANILTVNSPPIPK